MRLTTRMASAVDVPVLVAMMGEFYAEADYALDEAWATRSFLSLLGDPSRGAVCIACGDGVPLGYAVLTLRHSMEFGGLDGFIDDLFVRKASRRLGVGRAALEALLAECRRRGVLALHVETSDGNPAAVALYESLGMRDRKRLLLTARLTDRRESPLA